MTETFLEACTRHRDADMLRAGQYWREDEGKGCSVGCLAHDLGLDSDDHAGVAEHYNLPPWVIHLMDAMFEGLARAGDHQDWHVQFAAACEGVTDWQDCLHRVHVVILKTALETAGEATPVVQSVINLHSERPLQGSPRWNAAENAAENAAWWATGSAAKSAAWAAAWSAAWTAASDAARPAAWSPANSAAWSAASSTASNAAWTAANTAEKRAARAAAWTAASGAAYQRLRDAILKAMKEDAVNNLPPNQHRESL